MDQIGAEATSRADRPLTGMSDAENKAAFQRILCKLLDKRGLDFTEYRLSFLERRVESRLLAHRVEDFASYDKILESQPEELNRLFDTLTINVAEFFRDPAIWAYLEPNVFAPLVKRERSIRIWSAGCASGEEPYSIAIAIKEMVDKTPRHGSIKIMGSDVDPLALARARRGIYSRSALAKIPQARLEAFFTKRKEMEDGYEVSQDIRSMVKFYEHNYLKPPTFLDRAADVIFCRNSMIYLRNEAKNKAVSMFHHMLVPGGYLVLGVTEVLIGEIHYNQFHTVRTHPGVFQKKPS